MTDCRLCRRQGPRASVADFGNVETDDDLAVVLKHCLNEHPQSEVLADVVAETTVAVTCKDCGQEFADDLGLTHRPGEGRAELAVAAYCEACRGEGYRAIMARTMTAREAVANRQNRQTANDCHEANA